MKYRLLSEYGNRVIYTDSKTEKDRLIENGYHLDENYGKKADKDITEAPKPKRKKVVKQDEEGPKD